MATSYTSLLGFALPVTGELQGTWGDTVNNSITQLCEDSIAGVATASVLSSDWTLTTTGAGAANQARMAILIPTGSPGVSRNIIAPSKSKTYTVINQSNAAVIIKGAATTGVSIPSGVTTTVAWNGTDFTTYYVATAGTASYATTAGTATTATTANALNTANNYQVTNFTYTGTLTGSTGVINIGSGQLYKDSSGNVGIGTTSGSEKLTVNGSIASPVDAYLYSYTGSSAGTVSSGIRLLGSTSTTAFFTASSERMRIDSSGKVLIGATSSTGDIILSLQRGTATTWHVGPSTSSGNGANFYVVNSASNGVYLASGSGAWSSNSDERLKTDLKPIENAAKKVSMLRAVTGRYKKDEEGVSRSFLIAQDVQAVLPEAVNVQDDELGTLGVQYTDVIPLLVAAIKEQQTLIESLTARIATLEAK